MSTARTKWIGVLSAALLPLLSMPAAYAQQVSWNDATQDMWAFDEASESEEGALDPTHTNGDLERVTVTHRSRAVVIRMRFVTLDRTGEAHLFGGQVRTNERVGRIFMIEAFPGKWGGKLYVVNRSYRPVRGVTHDIDYATDVVRVRFPRSALSDPRWVQVQLWNAHGESVSQDQGFFWVDDAHSAGEPSGMKWSPRVYRG